MDIIDFADLGLQMPEDKLAQFNIGDKTIQVRQYLPIDEKADLIKYVVDWALDNSTGCFSPIRLDVFFSLALCRWYAGIACHFDQNVSFSQMYDILEQNGILDQVVAKIPDDEYDMLYNLMMETVKDIARYNNSAAGIIQSMSANAAGLDTQVTEILEKIKNGEGLETLSAIKDVVGNN